MMIFQSAQEGNIKTHNFDISGTTYEPVGEVWVSKIVIETSISD